MFGRWRRYRKSFLTDFMPKRAAQAGRWVETGTFGQKIGWISTHFCA
jgi:hypothetical protein